LDTNIGKLCVKDNNKYFQTLEGHTIDALIHLWGSRWQNWDYPDMAIFDLDLGNRAKFTDALQTALNLHDFLNTQSLQSFPKTSGGRGIHVYVPIKTIYNFDVVRKWVKYVANQLASIYPDSIAVAHGATHKGNKITIDYAQNSIGRNTAAPYTIRARPNAPISAPLTWDEIKLGKVTPADFTIRNMLQRINQVGDLFIPTLREPQELPIQ
jgi:bifunctional non-homologous end joining protein LigD